LKKNKRDLQIKVLEKIKRRKNTDDETAKREY
jgi:hypothetical protein